MNAVALALIAALAAPPTLGDGLRAIGALQAVDHTLDPPPPPPRTGAKVLLGVSGAALVAGLVGMAVTPGCATRDADRRCVDPRGSADAFPALVILGLGGLTTGAYWLRRDVAP
ncbi:MAG: hypothetical protein R3F60_11680 [bacterium]